MMTALKELDSKDLDINSFDGELLINEALSKHTSWRVGGPADLYYKPNSIEGLQQFLQQFETHIDITFIGLGSNLLVRDGGIRGVVIAPLGGLKVMQIEGDYLYAEAGVSCSKFARFCQSNEFIGMDFLAGIPGTIGGAAAMNAGAFGSEIWEFISHIKVIDRFGEISKIGKNHLTIGYREVSLASDKWIVGVCFHLNHKTKTNTLQTDIKTLLAKRNETQPIGLPSCGSVFRNPNNDYAARLIEQSGLKGSCIGEACVSEKHANFIINNGNCLASDIESLIEMVQTKVEQESGISLILEAHVLGEKMQGEL